MTSMTFLMGQFQVNDVQFCCSETHRFTQSGQRQFCQQEVGVGSGVLVVQLSIILLVSPDQKRALAPAFSIISSSKVRLLNIDNIVLIIENQLLLSDRVQSAG